MQIESPASIFLLSFFVLRGSCNGLFERIPHCTGPRVPFMNHHGFHQSVYSMLANLLHGFVDMMPCTQFRTTKIGKREQSPGTTSLSSLPVTHFFSSEHLFPIIYIWSNLNNVYIDVTQGHGKGGTVDVCGFFSSDQQQHLHQPMDF